MLKKLINTYFIPPILYLAMRLICSTLRVTVAGAEIKQRMDDEGKPIILVFWHGRLFYVPYHYRKTHSQWKVLISASADGETASRALSFFGYGIVRGSSYKNARKALRELTRHANNGFNIAIIADGSRGPLFTLQPGALMISKLTGAKALPVTFSFSKCWTLNSWDRMIIPKPFSKVVVMYGEPVSVPKGCDSATLEEKRDELEARLISITSQADKFFENTD